MTGKFCDRNAETLAMVGRDEGGDGTSISFRIMEGASESGKLGFPVSPRGKEDMIGAKSLLDTSPVPASQRLVRSRIKKREPNVFAALTYYQVRGSLCLLPWNSHHGRRPSPPVWDTCRVPPSGTPSLQVEPTVLTPDENRSCHSPNLDLWPLLFPDLPGVALRGSLLPSPPSSLSVFTDLISSLISLLLTECRRRRHL